jgi:hypothetical protein
MIYSKKCDFLFIKGKKVAGTSVEIALAAICGPEDIITPLTPIDELERLRQGSRGAQNYSDDPDIERMYLEGLTSGKISKELAIPRKKREFRGHMSLREFVSNFGSLPTSRIFCVERSPYAKIISSSNMSGKLKS